MPQTALSPRPPAPLAPAKGSDSAPFPLDPVLITAGAGVLSRSLLRRLFGWKHYRGSVEAICRAVIEDCWNGAFFAGSAGHFRQFWTRDLAMCTPALVRLGYRDRVLRSWEWALERFVEARRVTTTVFFRRWPRDVYAYACDSLPMLLYGLREARASHLVEEHRKFISLEVERYCETVFDPETGMARTDGYFSAPRDCMTGRSTVFANVMLASLPRLLDDLSLRNPLAGADVARRIMAQHWTGEFFRDALDRDLPSGDGNVWPFHMGIFGDDDFALRRRAFRTLEERGFTSPLPLRYFERRLPESELSVPRFFTPNYQGDPSWMQMGPIYLRLLRDIDEDLFLRHRRTVASFIDRDRNYLEVYRTDGKPYRGRAGTYFCDEGMIWAAMFLDLA